MKASLASVFTAYFLVLLQVNVLAQTSDKPLDIQGHRGCRGLMPENTIPAFIKAVELGVTTLELDVVISKDEQVVVSHEPFLSYIICQTPEGKPISEDEEKEYNLYEMSYSEISRCDCGSLPHPQFPEQERTVAYKPTLEEVIDTVEQFISEKGYPPVNYNIETKSSEAGDNIYHPAPDKFVNLLLSVLQKKEVMERLTIQSFDVRTLQEVRKKNPEIALALLVENAESPQDNLDKLGFTPEIYSPYFKVVEPSLMEFAQQKEMSVIPWTVNESEDIQQMIELGVDGIISDYPNRVIELAKKQD